MSTIYALSTAPFKSAVAVIRLSGSRSGPVLQRLTRSQTPLIPKQTSLRTLQHPVSGEKLDQCLTIYNKGPASFTGEDTVELHLHGSKAVIRAVLDAIPLCTDHIRHADPGEFSRRAFLNNKIDLSQAEGLVDLINSETEAQRRNAFRQSTGSIAQACDAWRDTLINLRSRLEAIIDFGEDNDIDGVETTKVLSDARTLRDSLQEQLDSSMRGELLRSGVKTVIFGPPNAGKSSLLNLLAMREISIVSSEAGTTRDVIESAIDLGGYPLLLQDTAGLRQGEQVSSVEKEGVRRARSRVSGSDLQVCVIPYNEELDGTTLDVIKELRMSSGLTNLVIVLNKADLDATPNTLRAVSSMMKDAQHRIVQVSCLQRTGVSELTSMLIAQLERITGAHDARENLNLNERQRAQVQSCILELDTLSRSESFDLVLAAEHLRYAGDALGRITGRIDVEEVLDKIFSTFCVGK